MTERKKGEFADAPTDTEVRGLPVAGYKPTQPPEAIAAVNTFKELEERTLRAIETLEVPHDCDWLIAGTFMLQEAFMLLNRAIFMPGRVSLPEDEPTASLFDQG